MALYVSAAAQFRLGAAIEFCEFQNLKMLQLYGNKLSGISPPLFNVKH
jgi:hypothetical protein